MSNPSQSMSNPGPIRGQSNEIHDQSDPIKVQFQANPTTVYVKAQSLLQANPCQSWSNYWPIFNRKANGQPISQSSPIHANPDWTIIRVKYSPFLKIQSANPCQSGGLTVSAVFWIGLGLADWTGLTWIGMPRWGVANACQFGPISQSWANPKPIEAPIWIGRAEANPVFSMPIHENAEANPEPMLA